MGSPIAHDGSNVHDAFGVRDTFEHSSGAAPFARTGVLLAGAGLLPAGMSLFREADVPLSVRLLCLSAVLLLFFATRRGRVMIRVMAAYTVIFALISVGPGGERFLLPVSSDPAPYLEAAGAWLLLAGGVVLLAAGSPKQADQGLWWVSLLVALLVGVPAVWVPMTRVPNIEHVTAAEVPPLWEGSPAATLSEHAWTWRPSRGGRIESVVSTPSVGLVLLGDGAVGLDPVSGREVWSYRHPAMGGESTSSEVDPTGERVRLSFETGPRYKGRVVLDAATGRVLETMYYRPGRMDGFSPRGTRTNAGFLRHDQGVLRHEGETSGGSWEHDPGKGCHTADDLDESDHTRSVGDMVLVSMVCEDEEAAAAADIDEPGLVGRIVALDLATGRELWRAPTGDAWPEEGLVPEPRDLRISVDESAVHTPEGDLVIDLDTGEVLHDAPEPFWGTDELVRVSADSFTALRRDGDLVRFVERDQTGGGTRVTGALAVDEDRAVSEALSLEDAVIRLVSGEPDWELAVHPWDGTEPRQIPLREDLAGGGGTNASDARFVPVHGTVFVHAGGAQSGRVLVALR